MYKPTTENPKHSHTASIQTKRCDNPTTTNTYVNLPSCKASHLNLCKNRNKERETTLTLNIQIIKSCSSSTCNASNTVPTPPCVRHLEVQPPTYSDFPIGPRRMQVPCKDEPQIPPGDWLFFFQHLTTANFSNRNEDNCKCFDLLKTTLYVIHVGWEILFVNSEIVCLTWKFNLYFVT